VAHSSCWLVVDLHGMLLSVSTSSIRSRPSPRAPLALSLQLDLNGEQLNCNSHWSLIFSAPDLPAVALLYTVPARPLVPSLPTGLL
jgi:hypothetical protein